jgi:hypothetical protein
MEEETTKVTRPIIKNPQKGVVKKKRVTFFDERNSNNDVPPAVSVNDIEMSRVVELCHAVSRDLISSNVIGNGYVNNMNATSGLSASFFNLGGARQGHQAKTPMYLNPLDEGIRLLLEK